MLPSKMRGALEWLFGLFGKWLTVLLLIWGVSSAIIITNNIVFVIHHKLTDEKIYEKNVEYRKAAKRLMEVRMKKRQRDSVKFEDYYARQTDTLWSQRFEQQKREFDDSLRRLSKYVKELE